MANKPVLHRRDHEHGGADTVRILWTDEPDEIPAVPGFYLSMEILLGSATVAGTDSTTPGREEATFWMSNTLMTDIALSTPAQLRFFPTRSAGTLVGAVWTIRQTGFDVATAVPGTDHAWHTHEYWVHGGTAEWFLDGAVQESVASNLWDGSPVALIWSVWSGDNGIHDSETWFGRMKAGTTFGGSEMWSFDPHTVAGLGEFDTTFTSPAVMSLTAAPLTPPSGDSGTNALRFYVPWSSGGVGGRGGDFRLTVAP